MGEFGIGQPVRRKEDVRLLTGRGRYTDDINLPGQLWAAFLRSPQAHAKIVSIDTEAAKAAPGVVGVFTGADMVADKLGTLLCESELESRDGKPMFKPLRHPLSVGAVHYVGEPMAIVVAETLDQARDAAEQIMVDFEELPAIADTAGALAPGAALVWPEHGSNLVVDWANEDSSRWDAAEKAAHKVVSVELVNNRVVASPMEPRAVVADFDPKSGRTTVYAPTQGGHRVQNTLAKTIFKIPTSSVRVVAYDTGGGFGVRSKAYPETVVTAYAARKLGRPVKWRGDRSETFVSDVHGRDQVNKAWLALDANAKILGLKVETIINVGAYLSENGPRLPIDGGGAILCGAYDIPVLYFLVKPVFTNMVPTDTYRGAGRPEANYIHERLMEAAAEAFGFSSVEIRRRNLVPPSKLPYKTQMGLEIDSGDFVGTVERSVAAADWNGFEKRRAEAKARGKLRGIGMAFFIEGAGGRPVEEMKVRITPEGKAEIVCGTYSHGQGHETVYAQLMNEFMGLKLEDTLLIQGDTDTMPENAAGTFGSRSSMMGGVAIKRCCTAIVDKGKKIAAHLLQAAQEEVAFADGVFRAKQSSMTLAEVAKAAHDARRLPDAMAAGLEEGFVYKRKGKADQNYPNGCHIAEVEVDPDTGAVQVVSFTAVDDCGTVLNPFIVHGQMHGGIAQGIGQALYETVSYDRESGQLLSGSYMDYTMPRAFHLPTMHLAFNEVPSVTNDLGVKGAGEAGACGAPPAVVHAVVNALKDYGIRHIDMPITSERVWRAIHKPRAA
ncbi:MAG TPA: xanthine dehydrogenase family protein molybdopterin-binding subunit [Alphaproteobacteria bacterium]|nr:xanthine dehydrogenase family protein molybdopterin-binding subunit [Alphaproteobacteria bacterium]